VAAIAAASPAIIFESKRFSYLWAGLDLGSERFSYLLLCVRFSYLWYPKGFRIFIFGAGNTPNTCFKKRTVPVRILRAGN
jgi:hypothetical protein